MPVLTTFRSPQLSLGKEHGFHHSEKGTGRVFCFFTFKQQQGYWGGGVVKGDLYSLASST